MVLSLKDWIIWRNLPRLYKMATTAPTVKKPKLFNLLKPYVPPLTGWDRIYDWLLGKARVIMVIAEIIVVFTFVTKVVVDTQAKGFEDDIKSKDFEMQRLAESVEPVLRKLQLKTQMYTQLWNGSNRYADIVKEIHGYIPNPGSELLININRDEVTISGEEDFATLARIEQAMKSSRTFSEVSVTQLNTDTSGAEGVGGDYVLTATIAKLKSRTPVSGSVAQ